MFFVDLFTSENTNSAVAASDFSDSLWLDASVSTAPRAQTRTQTQKIQLGAHKSSGAVSPQYTAHRESLNGRQYRNDWGVQLSSAPEAYATQTAVSARHSEIQAASPLTSRGRNFAY